MSTVEINQVLAQMRAMSAQASQVGESERTSTNGVDFGELIKASLDQVNASQSDARVLADAFEAGDKSVDLPQVMVELQKASVSFQAITQVRNKLLSAYQEVMSMQV